MWTLYALTILAGLANAIQPGQNATLSKSLGLPVTAALLTLLVSTAALLAGGLALGKLEIPSGQQLGQVPWWAWLGGFLSILLILAQLYASPAIGAALKPLDRLIAQAMEAYQADVEAFEAIDRYRPYLAARLAEGVGRPR